MVLANTVILLMNIFYCLKALESQLEDLHKFLSEHPDKIVVFIGGTNISDKSFT